MAALPEIYLLDPAIERVKITWMQNACNLDLEETGVKPPEPKRMVHVNTSRGTMMIEVSARVFGALKPGQMLKVRFKPDGTCAIAE